MTAVKFVKKIKNYAIVSFLVPLIALNSCLLIYKFFGNTDIKTYHNINWNTPELTYTWNEYNLVWNKLELRTFMNCPKYKRSTFFNYIDNQTLKTFEDKDENVELLA